MVKQTTWILVVDHQRKNVFRTEPPAWQLTAEAGQAREQRLPRGIELASDRQGRSFDSLGGQRHAMEPHSDPHALEGRRFIEAVAADLLRARREGLFDRLVLVAPPRAMGELRQALHHEVAACVAGELTEDLTQMPIKPLEALLAKHDLLPPRPLS